MAYDEGLEERIDEILKDRSHVAPKKMFGGVAYLLHGNMAVGIVGNDLMVRVGKEAYAKALKQPNVREMDFTKKPIAGFVFVDAEGVDDDAALRKWVDAGMGYAATLPKKSAKKHPSRKG
jgi:TfoX/Sxy family transcriptional regulator of competence genes